MPIKRLTDALITATAGWGVMVLVGEGYNPISTVVIGHSPVHSHVPGAYHSLEEAHIEHFEGPEHGRSAQQALSEAVKLAGRRLSHPTILDNKNHGVDGKEYHYSVLEHPELQN